MPFKHKKMNYKQKLLQKSKNMLDYKQLQKRDCLSGKQEIVNDVARIFQILQERKNLVLDCKEVIYSMWAKILAYAAKYGLSVVKWAWKNKWNLLSLGASVWGYIRKHA